MLAGAPNIADFLGEQSRTNFERIKEGLLLLNVPFKVDKNLVRGLDYYNHFIFEFVNFSQRLGVSQKTVLAGGRYDSLATQLGSKTPIPAIG